MPALDFQTADRLSLAELTALWGLAYEAYFVPLNFSEPQVRRHIDRSAIDLRRSLVGLVAGQPAALSLAAVRGDEAWIGGFGVAKAHRRQGLAQAMMAEQLARLDDVALVRLEVIDRNPAREVYRRAGFTERGESLLVLDGTPTAAPAGEGKDISAAELAAAYARITRVMASTWRRGLPTLLHDMSKGARAIAVPGAFAVVHETDANVLLLDAAANDIEAAQRLLTALPEQRPGRPFRLIDEPERSPLAEAMLAGGFAVALIQVEMVRPRS